MSKDKKDEKKGLSEILKEMKEKEIEKQEEAQKKHKSTIEAEVVPDEAEQKEIVDAVSSDNGDENEKTDSESDKDSIASKGNKIIIDMDSIKQEMKRETADSSGEYKKDKSEEKVVNAISDVAAAEGSQTMEEITAERDEFKDKFLRKAAELENYIKRSRKEREETRELIVADFILQMLAVTDNFERALAAQNSTLEQLLEGLKLTRQQLTDILKDYGLQPIPNSVGKPFDPQLHEAIFIEPTDEYPPNTIIEEYLKGYFLKDLILRPAKVRVAVPKENSETTEEETEQETSAETGDSEQVIEDSDVQENTDNSTEPDSGAKD